jgi:hypothetical protein
MITVLAAGSAIYAGLEGVSIAAAAATCGLIVWAHRGNISRHRAERRKAPKSHTQPPPRTPSG